MLTIGAPIRADAVPLPVGQNTPISDNPSSPRIKIFRFTRSANHPYCPPRPAPTRGAYRDRHGRGVGDAMAGSARQTSAQVTDGEGVWSWCPDAGIKSGVTNPQATEANKPGTPRRARYKP